WSSARSRRSVQNCGSPAKRGKQAQTICPRPSMSAPIVPFPIRARSSDVTARPGAARAATRCRRPRAGSRRTAVARERELDGEIGEAPELDVRAGAEACRPDRAALDPVAPQLRVLEARGVRRGAYAVEIPAQI